MTEKSLNKLLLSVGSELIDSHFIGIASIFIMCLDYSDIFIENGSTIDGLCFSLEFYSVFDTPLLETVTSFMNGVGSDKGN